MIREGIFESDLKQNKKRNEGVEKSKKPEKNQTKGIYEKNAFFAIQSFVGSWLSLDIASGF